MSVDLEAVEKCPLCGGRGEFKLSQNEHRIFDSDDCGFLFVHPYPTAEAVNEFYASDYLDADAKFYPKLNSRKRRAFMKALRFLHLTYGKKVLDLGCGGGVMAERFRRFGADSYGIDISDNSIDFARSHFPKCSFFCGSFDQFLKRNITFDFIFTTDVMEHLPGPHDCMRFIAASSKPGTAVYVATPDAGHPNVPEDLSSWSNICPPAHLQWFNKSNMERIFDDYGFQLAKSYKKKTAAVSLIFRKR
jgi:SAM-dependent methyltransferase